MNNKGAQKLSFLVQLINWSDMTQLIEGDEWKKQDLDAIKSELDIESDDATARAKDRFFDYM